MDTQPQFQTRSDQRWYIGLTAVIFLALCIAAGVGMWLWVRMTGPVIMVCGICLLTLVIMLLALKGQPNAQLRFEGDRLYIRHVDRREYTVYDVPAGDFIFRQTGLEKKYNVGRLQIKGTAFHFYGIQDFSETRRYVLANFPE